MTGPQTQAARPAPAPQATLNGWAPPAGPGRGAPIRRSALIGAVVVAAFFGGFGGWAALAPLAGAVLAPGVVSPEGGHGVVQHLEGGIIADVLVEDGSRVAAGDPLLVLEDTRARATYQQLSTRYNHLAATYARLAAEQTGANAIAMPAWLAADVPTEAGIDGILAAEVTLFDTRRAARQAQQDILRQRIAGLGEQIAGLVDQIAAQDTQIALIDEEIADVATLVRQGLERRPRLLALQRSRAEIEGAQARNHAAIAEAEQAIGEAQLQIIAVDTAHLDEVAGQIPQVQAELSLVAERLAEAEDALARTVVVAPAAGTVVGLQYRTPGGVVSPGAQILSIVPDDGRLLIDARVPPQEIEAVHRGLRAQVVLSAYRQRTLPQIEGVVQTVSADRLIDEATGQPYFLARIEVDPAALEGLMDQDTPIELLPGMPAEAMIMTGERTALDYLIGPLVDSFRRSFREG